MIHFRRAGTGRTTLMRRLGLAGILLCAAQMVQAAEPAPAGAQRSIGSKNSTAASAGLINDWLRGKSEAADPWDVGGSVRLRYDTKDDGGPFANNDFIHRGLENDNDYFTARTRVHLGYTPSGWLNLFAEGRDARAWGDDRPGNPENDEFDFYQGYFVLGNPKEFPLTLKVGRQEMLYGDERFVGVSDWTATGRSFDAAKLRFENDDFWVDAFVSRVVIVYDDHFNQPNDYDWFSGLYASTRKLIPWQESQLFFLARNVGEESPNASAPGVGGPGERDVYTLGTRHKSLPGKLRGWDYSTELAGQFGGIVQGGVYRDLRSFMADVTLGYTWEETWSAPRLGVGYTYASGDSDATDGDTETFEPLLGTNHSLYGLMDLFGLRNTHNPSASFSFKPAKGLSVRLLYLMFWLADDRDFLYPESGSGRNANGYGQNPQFDSYVGSEVDLVVSYQPPRLRGTEFQLGYGHFFVGDYIKQSVHSIPANGSAVDADWFYVQAKFSF